MTSFCTGKCQINFVLKLPHGFGDNICGGVNIEDMVSNRNTNDLERYTCLFSNALKPSQISWFRDIFISLYTLLCCVIVTSRKHQKYIMI